jgi:hypothetical protein
MQRGVLGISRHVFWEHPQINYEIIQRIVLKISTQVSRISRHVLWEHLNSSIGGIQRGVLGISRHVFLQHPDSGFGDVI